MLKSSPSPDDRPRAPLPIHRFSKNWTGNPTGKAGDRLHPSRDVSLDAQRRDLRNAFEQCRQSTLAFVTEMNQETLCRQAHPDFSPVGWHLGHIAYTEALWILQHLAGQPPLYPHYHKLFAADGLPKAERQHLPDAQTLYAYLDDVRHRTFEYLETAPVDQQSRIWWFLLQHESQHCETMTLVAEMLGEVQPMPHTSAPQGDRPATPMCHVPAGAFQMGSDAPDALDNERPAHTVYLDDYWIDAYPVTCRDFQVFIDAGGYGDRQWWSEEGWAWLQANPVSHPLYWSKGDSKRCVDAGRLPTSTQHEEEGDRYRPVCGVSWYEADAYARFVGKRLPTEAEWEKAARWNPKTGETMTYPWGHTFPNAQHCNHGHITGTTSAINRSPAGSSSVGCMDLLGNVWEWTSSHFNGYVGFQPFPYEGYSKAYFDKQHYVLRGGSWATRPWALRPSFRNWYHPWIRQIFSGIRCASSTPPSF